MSLISVLEILEAENDYGGIIEEDDAQLELQLALERWSTRYLLFVSFIVSRWY